MTDKPMTAGEIVEFFKTFDPTLPVFTWGSNFETPYDFTANPVDKKHIRLCRVRLGAGWSGECTMHNPGGTYNDTHPSDFVDEAIIVGHREAASE